MKVLSLNWFEYIKKGKFYDNLKDTNIRYIIFSWSSGSGKTTQVQTLYDFQIDSLYIAKRYITRIPRNWDNQDGFIENIYIWTYKEFQELINNWTIDIYRKRDLWSHSVMYWFENCSKIYENNNKIIIYSGNNDMIRNLDQINFYNKNEILHIHIVADDNDTRFINRSPEILDWDLKQFEKRMNDKWEDVFDKAHIVIYNSRNMQYTIKNELEEMIRNLLNI